MKNLRRRVVPLLALLVLLCGVMTVNAFAADDPTEEIGTKMIECPDCGAVGVVLTDEGTAAACESCGGTGYVESSSRFFNTFWSLLPPIIAIAGPHHEGGVQLPFHRYCGGRPAVFQLCL